MSLRKSPQLTPQRRAAARRNAQRSTGPRSPAGRQNSKMNALKHGERAAPENHYEVMRALGEDTEEFEKMKRGLMTSFGPGDAFWEKQIDDLARLYCRRERLERAQTGVMRCALQAVEEWQHHRQLEVAGATFDPSQSHALDVDMADPTDPGARLRALLSFLGVIREQVKQPIFEHRQTAMIRSLYQNYQGWRQARLCHLLWLFLESATPQGRQLTEEAAECMGDRREPAGEPQYQELLRLLEEEIAAVHEEFQCAEKVNKEKAAIERDACLAADGEQWKMMLRREETLDRSIDRKVRILLGLRKRSPAPPPSTGGQAEAGETEDVERIPAVRIASQATGTHGGSPSHPPILEIAKQGGSTAVTLQAKIDERSANVTINKGSPWPAGAGLALGFPNYRLMPALNAASPPRLAESLRLSG
jgi:hypothetical protein